MTNVKARKSFAIGLSALLVSAGLGAAPAHAVAGLTLTDKNETGKYTMIGGETFTLTGAGNADFVGDAKKLRFKITNVDGVALAAAPTITLDGGTSDLVDTANQASKADGSATDSALGATAGDTAVFALASDDASADATADGASIMTSPASISFTASPADNATASYKVDFFYDADNDGVLDAGEMSASQTVTFVHKSDVTTSIAITAPTEGDTTIAGSFNFVGIDGAQLTATEVGLYISDGQGNELANDGNADAATEAMLLVGGGNISYDSTDKRFEFETSALDTQTTGLEVALVKDTAVKAQVTFKSGGSPAKADVTGSAVTALVATRAAGEIKVDTVDSATTAVASAAATVTADVALNSTFAVKAIVKDTQSTPALLPGASVTAKITTTATLSGTAGSVVSIAVGGTTYTDGTKLPGATGIDKIALTTDANGEVSLTITTAGFSNGEDVVVAFTVENRTATITANNATKSYSAYVVGALDGVSTTSGSATLQFAVRDQFGGRPANGTYKVANDWVSSTQTTASTAAGTESSVSVVNGDAVMTVVSNGSGTGLEKFDFDLKTLAADGSYSATASIIDAFEIHHVSSTAVAAVNVTDSASSVVTQDATTKVYTDALVTGDGNSGELLVGNVFSHNGLTDVTSAPDVSSVVGATITGNVKTASSATVAAAAVPGAFVTLSAPGILFNYTADGSIEVYSMDSITVPTDKSGNFTVSAFSNLSGKQTVTLTSGSGSATLVLNKFDAADDGAGTSLTISASDYVSPGSTVIMTFALTDKYGNAVDTDGTNTAADGGSDFKVVYDGPGLIVGSNPTQTDADGAAKLVYFLGSNDSGTITVTASYDANGDADYADTGDLVVTKTITIGTPAVATWTKNLGSGSVKMYAKNIVGAGKVQFMLNGEEIAWVNASSSADSKLRSANGFYYLVRTVELVEGQKNVLEIYVDGVRTTRTAYTY